MSGVANIELTKHGWENTSLTKPFEPAEFLPLESFARAQAIPTGRDLEPQIWKKLPTDYSGEVERVVIRRFKQEIGHEIDSPERFEINSRLSDYLKDIRDGNGQVLAYISKQLYGNSATARDGSALNELYSNYKAHEIARVSLRDFITALSEDYNNYQNSLETD